MVTKYPITIVTILNAIVNQTELLFSKKTEKRMLANHITTIENIKEKNVIESHFFIFEISFFCIDKEYSVHIVLILADKFPK